MKRITVLGSTGSIGTQTLDVAGVYADEIEVVALTAGKNIALLEQQIRQFNVRYAAVWDEEDAKTLRANISDLKTEVLSGMEGLIALSTLPDIDMVVTAIVGMIGIQPTIAAINAGKDIALANKETLVCAGHIIIPLAKEKGVSILPVDSEHSAIFQCLGGEPAHLKSPSAMGRPTSRAELGTINGENRGEISKILLTASGGPFRGKTRDELAGVTVKDALKHPNWSMGAKITIDSSTMVNKGLEVMEAKWLFGVDYDQVKVVVQPKSVIHSMVEFKDGAVMAQLGTPDMRLPIQYALLYPKRKPISGGSFLDFDTLTSITFEKPDMETFTALKLAYEVGRRGGNMPTVYNAANEVANEKFRNGQITYLQIMDMIEKACEEIEFIDNPSVEEILETQRRVNELLS